MGHPIDRRQAIKIMGLSALAAFSAPCVITPSRATARRIVVRDEGGIFTRAYQKVCYQPFTQATGIEVVVAASKPAPAASIRMMVETKNYQWDMAVVSQPVILALTAGNNCFLAAHELEQDSIVSSIPPRFLLPHGVGTSVFSTVLTYRTNTFKGRRVPATWEDLWDLHRFPGRRGLFQLPRATIELALMADGVPPSQVYPCDLDRAFRRLDTLKEQITIWWKSGPQVEQALKSGELDITSAFHIRAQAAIDAGAPIAFSWNQHIYGCNCWAILNGTPNADACRQLIRFASNPKRQALLAPWGITPTHPDAFNTIGPLHARRLAAHPDQLKKGLYTDAAYWLKNEQVIFERFDKWLLS